MSKVKEELTTGISEILDRNMTLEDENSKLKSAIEYWKRGHAIIEECLAKAHKADPFDAPMPLIGDEARAWHYAQMNAYLHSLEMMGIPSDLPQRIDL